MRDDQGKLWENFLASERLKTQQYRQIFANNYFWRTWSKQEIDWLEEREGKLFGFEFKFSSAKIKSPRVPSEFLKTYQNSQITVINPQNYLGFLGVS
jgi:hypothetical protein